MENNEKIQTTVAVGASVAAVVSYLKFRKEKKAHAATIVQATKHMSAIVDTLIANSEKLTDAQRTGDFDEVVESVKFDMIAARFDD